MTVVLSGDSHDGMKVIISSRGFPLGEAHFVQNARRNNLEKDIFTQWGKQASKCFPWALYKTHFNLVWEVWCSSRVCSPAVSLTVNHLEVHERGDVGGPPTAHLHATHVPAGVVLRHVVHGHSEHQLHRVIGDAHFVPGQIDCAVVVRAGQAAAELPRPPLAPVLDVAGVLGLVVARHFYRLALQDDELAGGGHCALDGWMSRTGHSQGVALRSRQKWPQGVLKSLITPSLFQLNCFSHLELPAPTSPKIGLPPFMIEI